MWLAERRLGPRESPMALDISGGTGYLLDARPLAARAPTVRRHKPTLSLSRTFLLRVTIAGGRDLQKRQEPSLAPLSGLPRLQEGGRVAGRTEKRAGDAATSSNRRQMPALAAMTTVAHSCDAERRVPTPGFGAPPCREPWRRKMPEKMLSSGGGDPCDVDNSRRAHLKFSLWMSPYIACCELLRVRVDLHQRDLVDCCDKGPLIPLSSAYGYELAACARPRLGREQGTCLPVGPAVPGSIGSQPSLRLSTTAQRTTVASHGRVSVPSGSFPQSFPESFPSSRWTSRPSHVDLNRQPAS
ncbi:hypothetical protein GGR56DRAFT_231259 [Xylariaceae sp. FL0804]|nr:hypothetical protein GGR56DRAFT_231259 [Xylariaceae sp. FL0804]